MDIKYIIFTESTIYHVVLLIAGIMCIIGIYHAIIDISSKKILSNITNIAIICLASTTILVIVLCLLYETFYYDLGILMFVFASISFISAIYDITSL